MASNFCISPFNILLNNLSNELNQMNLQSLKHVCRELIPGGQQDRISTGLDIFSILLQRNAIGEEPEKMAFLLGVIKELRPERIDLVSMVKRYIEKYYEQPEAILDEDDFSSDSYRISRCSTPTLVDHADCCAQGCAVRCGACFDCSCNPCRYCSGCCCCVFVVILFSFLAVMAAVFWYTRSFPGVNDYLHSKENLRDAGPAIIGILAFIAACCVLCGIYISVKKRRNNLPYSVLYSVSNARSTQAVRGSNADSESTRTSCSGYERRIDRSRRREHSCSSGPITASSSFASTSFRGSPPDPNGLSREINAEQKNNDNDPLV